VQPAELSARLPQYARRGLPRTQIGYRRRLGVIRTLIEQAG